MNYTGSYGYDRCHRNFWVTRAAIITLQISNGVTSNLQTAARLVSDVIKSDSSLYDPEGTFYMGTI